MNDFKWLEKDIERSISKIKEQYLRNLRSEEEVLKTIDELRKLRDFIDVKISELEGLIKKPEMTTKEKIKEIVKEVLREEGLL